MSEQVEKNRAKSQVDLLGRSCSYAEARENVLNDQFVSLEIQIASIILGLTGVSSFWTGKIPVELSAGIVLAVGAFSLAASLVLGLIVIHVRSRFWEGRMRTNRIGFEIWRSVLLVDGMTEKQAENDLKIFDKGSNNDSTVVSSPKWPYYWQTTTLGIGVSLVLVGYILQFILTHVSKVPS